MVAAAALATAGATFVRGGASVRSQPTAPVPLHCMHESTRIAAVRRVGARTAEVTIARGPRTHTREFELANGRNELLLEGRDVGAEEDIELVLFHYGTDAPLTIGWSSVPALVRPRYSVADFAYPISALGPDQRALADELLTSAGVVPDDPPVARIEKLAAFLHGALEAHRGVPAPHMRSLDALQQYQEAVAGRSKVFCANHAEIFSCLATAAGVPTRIVDVGGGTAGVATGAHAFNECYLSDRDQWAYVDVQLHVLLPVTQGGEYLCGVDLLRSRSRLSLDGASIRVLSGSSATSTDLSTVMDEIRDYVPPSATLTYLWAATRRFTPWRRIERIALRPQSSFSLDGGGFGARLVLVPLYVGILSGLLALVAWTLERRGARRAAVR